jgi:hypothetical protein
VIIGFGGATLHVQFTYDVIVKMVKEACKIKLPDLAMNLRVGVSTVTCVLIAPYFVHSAYRLSMFMGPFDVL